MDGDYCITRARAHVSDAQALLNVEADSLGDSGYDVRRIVQILRRPEHHTYLARKGSQAVGFCSCFETPVGDSRRLEIDMLGVSPAHRGRGVGTALVSYALQEACGRQIDGARAVVAQNNVASLRVFRHAGFDPSWPHHMLLYEILGRVPISLEAGIAKWEAVARAGATEHVFCRIEDVQGRQRALADLLEVQTMAYTGYWIEHLQAESAVAARSAARAVVESAKRRGLDQVGYLLRAEGNEKRRIALIREGFQTAGLYRYLSTSCR